MELQPNGIAISNCNLNKRKKAPNQRPEPNPCKTNQTKTQSLFCSSERPRSDAVSPGILPESLRLFSFLKGSSTFPGNILCNPFDTPKLTIAPTHARIPVLMISLPSTMPMNAIKVPPSVPIA